MADRPLFIRLSMPSGLEDALEGLAREVLRAQPKDMLEFSAEYFEGLLRTRNKGNALRGVRRELSSELRWYYQGVITSFGVCCLHLSVYIFPPIKWPSQFSELVLLLVLMASPVKNPAYSELVSRLPVMLSYRFPWPRVRVRVRVKESNFILAFHSICSNHY